MDRFWSKVDKTAGCWEWTALKRTGYGLFRVGKNIVSAHRYSYELEYGPIPKGKLIRHKCDNRGCVRPDHLEVGGRVENSLDMKERGRGFSKLTNDFVVEARHRTAGGESVHTIIQDAPEGVRLLSLANAIRGKTFSHLADGVEPIFEKRIYQKLSDKEYQEIIDDLNTKKYRGQGRALAKKYGVDPSLITLIRKDKLKTIRRVSFE